MATCSPTSVLPLFGSIAGAESVLLALDRTWGYGGDGEAPHGTAPALEGKDIANPMGMILAGGARPPLRGRARASRVPTARHARLRRRDRDGRAGIRTPDLKGHASTTEFTDR